MSGHYGGGSCASRNTISSRRSCSASACSRLPPARRRGRAENAGADPGARSGDGSRVAPARQRPGGSIRNADNIRQRPTHRTERARGRFLSRSAAGHLSLHRAAPQWYPHRLQGQGPARSRRRTPISRSNGDRAGRRANRADLPSMCGRCRRNWAKRISIRCAMSARPKPRPEAGSQEAAMRGRTTLFAGSLLGIAMAAMLLPSELAAQQDAAATGRASDRRR